MIIKRLLLLPAFATIVSCASHLTQEQCLTINWHIQGFNDAATGKLPRDLTGPTKDCEKFGLSVNRKQYVLGYHQGAEKYCLPDASVGYADGAAGQPENAILGRTPVCNQAGIKLNLKLYQPGRKKGLKVFCTRENGMNIARQGIVAPDVCPTELRNAFSSGYASGRDQYCSQSQTGFSLGKAGSAYPELCNPAFYPAFRAEYDRGATIASRINGVTAKLNDINSGISSKVNHFDFIQNASGYYDIGKKNTSKEAHDALADVNRMVHQRLSLDREIFDLKVMN